MVAEVARDGPVVAIFISIIQDFELLHSVKRITVFQED